MRHRGRAVARVRARERERENGVSRPVSGDPCPKRRHRPWRRHPSRGQAPAQRPPRTVAGGQGNSGGLHETHRRPDHLWSGQWRADARHRLPAATRRDRQRAQLRFPGALQDGLGDRRRPAAGRGCGRFRRGAALQGMRIGTGMPCGGVRRCGTSGWRRPTTGIAPPTEGSARPFLNNLSQPHHRQHQTMGFRRRSGVRLR